MEGGGSIGKAGWQEGPDSWVSYFNEEEFLEFLRFKKKGFLF